MLGRERTTAKEIRSPFAAFRVENPECWSQCDVSWINEEVEIIPPSPPAMVLVPEPHLYRCELCSATTPLGIENRGYKPSFSPLSEVSKCTEFYRGRDLNRRFLIRRHVFQLVCRLLLNVAVLLPIAACARTSQHYDAARDRFTFEAAPEKKSVDMGVACYVQDKDRYGVASYSVRDEGRVGVPPLSSADAQTIRRIERYFSADTLRFADTGTEVVVFNARQGPCGEDYRVLNGACNEGYSPRDHLTGTVSFPGECRNMPRPWIPNDPKEGNVPWRTYYDARSSP